MPGVLNGWQKGQKGHQELLVQSLHAHRGSGSATLSPARKCAWHHSGIRKKARGKRKIGRPPEPYSQRIARALNRAGYEVQAGLLKAVDYGVPQLRPRYFLMAARRGISPSLKENGPFKGLNALRDDFLRSKGLPLDRPVTVKEALADLETVDGTEQCGDSPGFMQGPYASPTTPYQLLMRDKLQGRSPDSHRLANHRLETVERFGEILATCRRGVQLNQADRNRFGLKKHCTVPLDPDRPSHTLTTLPDDIIHYSEPRTLTVREYARLQSIPDWFQFRGAYTTGGNRRIRECPRYTQAGNAVPPLVGEAIGTFFTSLHEQFLLSPLGQRLGQAHRMDQSRSLRPGIRHFRMGLLEWYQQHGRRFPWRRRSASNYNKIVAEVLLQRTRAETVARFFPTFVSRYPSWRELAMANENELFAVIHPVGLWRKRSISLMSLAREMVKRNGRFPKDRENLESLPGVGQYIANSIMLLCHNRTQPLLDINMARVMERYFGPRTLSDIRYDPYLQRLARVVVDCPEAIELNWAILDFAAGVCMARRPRCTQCNLASECRFAKESGFQSDKAVRRLVGG